MLSRYAASVIPKHSSSTPDLSILLSPNLNAMRLAPFKDFFYAMLSFTRTSDGASA